MNSFWELLFFKKYNFVYFRNLSEKFSARLSKLHSTPTQKHLKEKYLKNSIFTLFSSFERKTFELMTKFQTDCQDLLLRVQTNIIRFSKVSSKCDCNIVRKRERNWLTWGKKTDILSGCFHFHISNKEENYNWKTLAFFRLLIWKEEKLHRLLNLKILIQRA